MRGKLIGVGGAGDPLTSPHTTGPIGGSPAATPRSTACPVGLYYFLILFEPSSAPQTNDPSTSVSVGSSVASSLRASLPTTMSRFQPGSSMPVHGNGRSADSTTAVSSAVTYVVAIDGVTGQLFFSGVPKVDMFPSEAAALLAIPSKVSLAPEGVRLTTICHFDAWCGCYASDDFLHFLFVSESSPVHPHPTSSPSPQTYASPPPQLARSATAEWLASDDPVEPHRRGTPTTIQRIDRMLWKSIRLQCPQHVLTHHNIPPPSTSQHARPPSHRLDDTRRSNGDISNHSTDGAAWEQRPPEFPTDYHATLFSSSEQLNVTAPMDEPGTTLMEKKGLHYSDVFDIAHAESTRLYFADLHKNSAGGRKGGRQLHPSKSKYFLPARVILKPEFRLIHTEHLWNVELIHYCESSCSGVGDLCTRMIYGVVIGNVSPSTPSAQPSLGASLRSPSPRNTPTASLHQHDGARLGAPGPTSAADGGPSATAGSTHGHANTVADAHQPREASVVTLISRVSRVAYRQSLVELHRNPIRSSHPAAMQSTTAAAATSAAHAAPQNTGRHHHATSQHGQHVPVPSTRPPMEIHIAMECELQLILHGFPSPPREEASRAASRAANDSSSFCSFVWFRGISHGVDAAVHQPAGTDHDIIQKQVVLRQARERRHRSALQDCVLPATAKGHNNSHAGSPVVAGGPSRVFLGYSAHGTPSLSPMTSPTPNLSSKKSTTHSGGLNNNNASFWDAQTRQLAAEAAAAAEPLQLLTQSVRAAAEQNLGHYDDAQATLMRAHYKLRRCGLSEEKHLGASLMAVFTWATEAIAATAPHLLQSDVLLRSPVPSHSSLLGCLWHLFFREAAVQFSTPDLGATSYTTFSDAVGFVRRLASHRQYPQHESPRGWLGFDDAAAIQSLLAAGTMLPLSDPSHTPTLDHRYAGFLQLLVELPRTTRLRIGSHRPVVLLSDPCSGAALVRAYVTVQTNSSSQGRSEAVKKPLVSASSPAPPPAGGSQQQNSVHSMMRSPSTASVFNSGPGGTVPLPSIDVLKTILMPKSPPLNIPEGHEVVAFTIALSQLSRITHVGIVVPSTLQDSMFASPLSISVTSGEYLSPVLERVLLQDASLPLCVGNSGTNCSSMVLFPISSPDVACDGGAATNMIAAEQAASISGGAVPAGEHHSATAASRRVGHLVQGQAASQSATSGMSWLALPPSESTAHAAVGRLVTVTIRASGKISTLLGNIMIFGHSLLRPEFLEGPLSRGAGSGTGGGGDATNKLHPTSQIANSNPARLPAALSTVMMGVGTTLAPLTPEQEMKRLLLEEYHSLQSKVPDGGAGVTGSAWSGRSRRNSSFAVVDPSALLKTFSLQISDRLRVTEDHRSILLNGRGIQRSKDATRNTSRSPSEESEGVSPLAGRSPVHSVANLNAFMEGSSAYTDSSPRPLQGMPSVSPRLQSSSAPPPPQTPHTRSPSVLTTSVLEVESSRGPSGEEQFMLQLATIASSAAGTGGSGIVELCDAAALETFRLKVSLSRVARDRCCMRAGIPSWLLDFANHLQPRSLFFDSSAVDTSGGGKKGKGNQCMRCMSKLSFLSKKKECYACGNTLCVRCSVPQLTALLELGVLDATATVCFRCLERANRVHHSIGEFAKAINCVALVAGAHPGFRPQALTRRAWATPQCGAKFLAQREVLGAPLMPPTTPQLGLRSDLYLSTIVQEQQQSARLRESRDNPFTDASPTSTATTQQSKRTSYNLCLANSVRVISNPRFRQPTAATAAQTNITSVIGSSASSIANAPLRRRTDFFECILGCVEAPGRGWRCMTAEEGSGGPRTAVIQRSVVLLLPAHAEVHYLRFEFVRHKPQAPLFGSSVGALPTSGRETPQNTPLASSPSTSAAPNLALDVGSRAPGAAPPRRQPSAPRDGSVIQVALFLADSTDLFTAPMIEWSSNRSGNTTERGGVFSVVASPPLPSEGCGGEASGGNHRGQLVCIRFTGTVQDLCSVELLHCSLWGEYVVSGDASSMTAATARQMFPVPGEGSRGHSQLRYSLRHAMPSGAADTPVHRHLSMMSQSVSSFAIGGSVGSSNHNGTSNNTNTMGSVNIGGANASSGGVATMAGHHHVNAVCAHLPYKARPLAVKAVLPLTACVANFSTEYDLGNNAVTVCGVVIEHYHPVLCHNAVRIATKLRFFGTGADGRRGNIGVIALPVPLIPTPSSSHGDSDTSTAASGEPLSMAFAFPSSSHNLRTIQVEAVEWIRGPQYAAAISAVSAAAGSGGGGGAGGNHTHSPAGSTGGGGATAAASEMALTAPNTWPYAGRLTFWTSPDAHTRRMVASGTYFSVFSSRDNQPPSRQQSPVMSSSK